MLIIITKVCKRESAELDLTAAVFPLAQDRRSHCSDQKEMTRCEWENIKVLDMPSVAATAKITLPWPEPGHTSSEVKPTYLVENL